MVIAQRDVLRAGIAAIAALAFAAIVGMVSPGRADAAVVSYSPSISAASSSVAANFNYAAFYNTKEATTFAHSTETTYAVMSSNKFAAEQDFVNIHPVFS